MSKKRINYKKIIKNYKRRMKLLIGKSKVSADPLRRQGFVLGVGKVNRGNILDKSEIKQEEFEPGYFPDYFKK